MVGKSVVIKVGTNVLVSPYKLIKTAIIQSIADQVATLYTQGNNFLITTSGAVACGSGYRIPEELPDIAVAQLAAAIGQPQIMGYWQAAFSRHGLPCGQLLRTQTEFANHGRKLSASAEFVNLLRAAGIIGILNEDDTRSPEELKNIQYAGDNDRLAALAAVACRADLLVIITDVDGVFLRNPKIDPGAELIPVIKRVTSRVMRLVEPEPNGRPTGLSSKLKAARYAQERGVTVVITGHSDTSIIRAVQGETSGTLFPA